MVKSVRALSAQQRLNIEAAVTAAEKRTSAEFAVVIARASDDYAYFPLLWAGLLALMSGGVVAIAWPGLSVGISFAIQAGIFIASGLLLRLTPLRTWIVPGELKREYASRLAHLQFANLVNGRTPDAVALLFFVSLAERHVEILIDNRIREHIPQTSFQSIIDTFIAAVRQGEIEQGLIGAIAACTAMLQQYFPARADEPDDLANQIIEI